MGVCPPTREKNTSPVATIFIDNFIKAITQAYLTLPPSTPFHYFYSMINKNIAHSSPPRRETQPQQASQSTVHNATTSKQRDSMLRFQQELEQDRMVEDAPIHEEQEQLPHQSPESLSVSPQRRSLIRQKQLWAQEEYEHHRQEPEPEVKQEVEQYHEEVVTQQEEVVQQPEQASSRQQLLFVSDEYYNESVPHQTLLFLEKLRAILLREEQTLSSLRRERLEAALSGVRAEFGRLREALLRAVEAWSRRVEEAEVASVVQRGEVAFSGAAVELAARVGTRREEIEQRMAELTAGLAQTQLTHREQALRRNQQLKHTVRQVWTRDYEHEVSELQDEAASLRLEPATTYRTAFSGGELYERDLHTSIHDILSTHELFRVGSAPYSRVTLSPAVEGKRAQAHSPASTHREQVLQSLMEQRMREIDLESKRVLNQYQL